MIPEHEIGGDNPESMQWDIIVILKPERDEEGNQRLLTPLDPKLYQEGGRHVPVAELLEDESSNASKQSVNQSQENTGASEAEQESSEVAPNRTASADPNDGLQENTNQESEERMNRDSSEGSDTQLPRY